MWRCRWRLTTQRAGRLANVEIKTPDVLATPEYKRDADIGAYDLVIYDQCAPATAAARECDVYWPTAARGGVARWARRRKR